MKKIMLFGTFDILHPGHINLFKQAKTFGDYLIVVLAQDETIKTIKGNYPQNNIQTRQINLQQTGLIDKVLFGGTTDKYDIIKREAPDTICLGYDQQVFTDRLTAKIKEYQLNTKIVRLKAYQPKIYKSSIIRKLLNA